MSQSANASPEANDADGERPNFSDSDRMVQPFFRKCSVGFCLVSSAASTKVRALGKSWAKQPISMLIGVVCGLALLLSAVPNPASAQSPTTTPTSTLDTPAATSTKGQTDLSVLDAVILGTVEGVTEYLPISSTGHLHITERLLGVGDTPDTKDAADSYAIAIQAGAILAVLVLFWRRILTVFQGLIGRSVAGRKLLIALLVAFVPAIIFGLALEKVIKEHLLAAGPIAFAWVVGAIAIFALARYHQAAKNGVKKIGAPLESITLRQAGLIGAAQCLALWPGTSRSLVTLAAGLLVGLSLDAAVEFAFLLGLMTLGAGTAYEGLKNGSTMVDAFGLPTILIGVAVAFVTAVVSVKWMVEYLKQHSLAVFGWYRLGAAAVVVGLLAFGGL